MGLSDASDLFDDGLPLGEPASQQEEDGDVEVLLDARQPPVSFFVASTRTRRRAAACPLEFWLVQARSDCLHRAPSTKMLQWSVQFSISDPHMFGKKCVGCKDRFSRVRRRRSCGSDWVTIL